MWFHHSPRAVREVITYFRFHKPCYFFFPLFLCLLNFVNNFVYVHVYMYVFLEWRNTHKRVPLRHACMVLSIFWLGRKRLDEDFAPRSKTPEKKEMYIFFIFGLGTKGWAKIPPFVTKTYIHKDIAVPHSLCDFKCAYGK